MMTTATPTPADELPGRPRVPEPGQVVTVRGMTWVVTDVRPQGLSRSPADEGAAALTHVVGLQSLADDRLGEDLQVVWELEVGQSVAPDQGLPERIDADAFDDPATLAAFVDAVRWGAVTSADADSYQAPFRSGATVKAYQLEPLRRALQASRTNLLLADDVGLGKTIEAGLVVQELLLRHRARSVVVLCPPSLALKWRDEMREKFGLEFVIVDSALMADVRRSHGLAANPFRLFPRVIVSMAWLPGVRAQRLLRDVYADVRDTTSARRYAFDLLVVDEAHHVAPSGPSGFGGRRGYAVDSNRTVATRALAEHCEHRLFLSATPHNGYSESFTALLEMIDGRRFSRGAALDEDALREVTVRRLKIELRDEDFRPRRLETISFTPADDEQEEFGLLDRILADTAHAAARHRSGDIVALLLKKRFLSSPWSFARTLELYDDATTRSGLPDLDGAGDDEYYQQVLGSDASDEEEGLAAQPEFDTLRRSKGSDPLSGARPGEVTALVAWGRRFEHKPDSRLRALLTFLDATCRPDGRWNNERVVVFTEYAATLDWIAGVLRQQGYGDVLAVIQGSTPPEERELVRARFTADPTREPVRVLLATDSAGEGIDLQDHCHRLVNYDVPFNPSRLEQRIGRIDRYGQREEPTVYRFAPNTSSTQYAADLGFVSRLVDKVAQARADLGAVNQVVDDDVQQHFARGPRSRRRAAPDRGDAVITRALAGGLELNRRLTELSRTYDERKVAMHLTPDNARRVVDTALTITAQPPLEEVGDPDTDAAVFRVPALAPRWQSALEGLDTRLEPGVRRPITFDDRAGSPSVVHVHLGHPLLQRSARLLRSALFSADSPVRRVTAVVVDGLPESCVAVVSRLVLVGRGGLRLHEEVFLTGVRLRGQALAEEKVERVLDEALDAADLTLADHEVRAALAQRWNTDGGRLRTRLLAAMTRRAEGRRHAVTDRLDARHTADTTRAHEIYAAFRVNLRESRDHLAEDIRTQEAGLFTDDQQAQRRRDLRAMEDRLDSLDGEERREVEAIDARYAEVSPHVSAAAVVFALTPQDAVDGAAAVAR